MAKFRHKSVARYSIASKGNTRFEFKDYYFSPKNEADEQEFRRLVGMLPPREARQIVEVDEVAAAAAERPVRVVRGAQDSGTVPSGVKDLKGRTIASAAQQGLTAEESKEPESKAKAGDGSNLDIGAELKAKAEAAAAAEAEKIAAAKKAAGIA